LGSGQGQYLKMSYPGQEVQRAEVKGGKEADGPCYSLALEGPQRTVWQRFSLQHVLYWEVVNH
jgi:hypothetical protein